MTEGHASKSISPEQRIAVIVAHPDDEILWSGGWILSHPTCDWFIATLCRASDPDRAPRFRRVVEHLGVTGKMADLDDGPEQSPLPGNQVEAAILSLLPLKRFDLVMTHGPRGEYTRHRRHEETCRAVVRLWERGRIETRQLWMFAYDDAGGTRLPLAAQDAHVKEVLAESCWREKYRMMTELYGFAPSSWEARTTPREEALWCFDTPEAARAWIISRKPTE